MSQTPRPISKYRAAKFAALESSDVTVRDAAIVQLRKEKAVTRPFGRGEYIYDSFCGYGPLFGNGYAPLYSQYEDSQYEGPLQQLRKDYNGIT